MYSLPKHAVRLMTIALFAGFVGTTVCGTAYAQTGIPQANQGNNACPNCVNNGPQEVELTIPLNGGVGNDFTSYSGGNTAAMYGAGNGYGDVSGWVGSHNSNWTTADSSSNGGVGGSGSNTNGANNNLNNIYLMIQNNNAAIATSSNQNQNTATGGKGTATVK